MNILSEAKAEFAETVRLRRYFHEYPELSNEEEKTIAFLESYLKGLGLETVNVPDGGLLAILDSGKKGRTLLMRSDTDALPIKESEKNLQEPKACISKIPGVSHACGHDGHMAMTLTAARILAAHKDEFVGKIVFCFERGEETSGDIRNLLPYIVHDLKLSIDGCYATHVRWDMAAGTVSLCPGPVMSGGCAFVVELSGQFGHGARPDLARSPIDCFHAIYSELSSFRMRRVDPFECLTISLGFLHSGDQYNVIPGTLTFGGTARFFSYEKAGSLFETYLKKTLDHLTALYQCSYKITHMPKALYEVRNNETCAALGRKALVRDLGKDAVVDAAPWMASESFALFQKLYPGVLSFTGIQNTDLGCGANHHTPEFDMDERGLMMGSAMAVSYALAFLAYEGDIPFKKTDEPVEELVERNI